MAAMSHSESAALRGEPSYVWRSGQERRLQMLATHVSLNNAHILEAGLGLGMYASQLARRYTPHVAGLDIEFERVHAAQEEIPAVVVAEGEYMPYPDHAFDVVFSNEVIEHVADDRAFAKEMVRVTRSGGHVALFCPNRWYPFETHGHYWKGDYHFGNTPLINYLPNRWRNQLAPHVRAYTADGIRAVFADLPVKVVHHSRIFGGYDNIYRRSPTLGRVIRGVLYPLEKTPLRWFGLSHWLVLQKTD